MDGRENAADVTLPYGRLVLEGDFVDAFPHLGSIWMIDHEGGILAFDVARFAHERLRGAHRQRDAAFAHGRVVVERADVVAHSTLFADRIAFRSVLDMACHAGSAFVATEAAIHRIDLRGLDDLRRPDAGGSRLGCETIHEGRCLGLQARDGLLVAACGDDGGFLGTTSEAHPLRKGGLARFAERSLAVGFAGRAILNAASGGLGLESHGAARDASGAWRATDGGSGTAQGEGRMDPFRSRNGADPVRAFPTADGAFVVDSDGNAHLADVIAPHGEGDWPLGRIPGRVIGVSASPEVVVAETDDAVHVSTGGGWIVALDEEVFSCRGHAASGIDPVAIAMVGDGHADLCMAFP